MGVKRTFNKQNQSDVLEENILAFSTNDNLISK